MRKCVVATLELRCGEGWEENIQKPPTERFLPTGPARHAPLAWEPARPLVTVDHAIMLRLLKGLPPRDSLLPWSRTPHLDLSPTDLRIPPHPVTSGHAEEISWRLENTPFNAEGHTTDRHHGVQEGTVASFPLKLETRRYLHRRAGSPLVGDAAHTIHPLVGQGLNQSQGDVQSLAKTIEFAVNRGLDIGTRMSLEFMPRPLCSESCTSESVISFISFIPLEVGR